MARQDGWMVEIQPSGLVDLFLDRRVVHYDLDDVDEAVRTVRRSDGDATEVTVVEPDGYRTTVRI